MSNDTLTLALDVAALRRLADPERAVADAEAWTEEIGVVGDDPRVVRAYARDHDLPEFFVGPRTKHETLGLLRDRVATDRHVFVGVDDRDRELAETTGWEFLDVDEAAAKAGWDTVRREGLVDALRSWLGRE